MSFALSENDEKDSCGYIFVGRRTQTIDFLDDGFVFKHVYIHYKSLINFLLCKINVNVSLF